VTGLRFSRSELHLQSRSWPGQRFGSAVLAGLALLVWLLADGVSASEESALLTGHGLKEFNAERYEEALRLFEQAVTADPMDVEARYQRGVTSGRLGKAELAIGDLSFVLEQRPKHMQAALELGIAFVSAQRYREAEAWLRRAQEVAELDAHSSFFLGLSQLHLDELADARQNFERAARNEELLLASRYYLGVIHYRLREWDEARVEFAFVAEGSPDSYMGGEANRYLNFIQQIAKTYWVHADLGVLYDSNVVLAPTDGADAVVVSNEGDGLVTLAAGGA
jgi:tetratricopeptide (TPR) repeat protein